MALSQVSMFMLLAPLLYCGCVPVSEELETSPIVEGIMASDDLTTTAAPEESVELKTTPSAAPTSTRVPTVTTVTTVTHAKTTQRTTQKSTALKVEVMVAPTSGKSQVSIADRRCCRIGRKAARRGYSCYVDMAILERRLNMPHRYKMKFSVHGSKYGNGFANKLQYCGNDKKRQRIFTHCCEKNAAVMDF